MRVKSHAVTPRKRDVSLTNTARWHCETSVQKGHLTLHPDPEPPETTTSAPWNKYAEWPSYPAPWSRIIWNENQSSIRHQCRTGFGSCTLIQVCFRDNIIWMKDLLEIIKEKLGIQWCSSGTRSCGEKDHSICLKRRLLNFLQGVVTGWSFSYISYKFVVCH